MTDFFVYQSVPGLCDFQSRDDDDDEGRSRYCEHLKLAFWDFNWILLVVLMENFTSKRLFIRQNPFKVHHHANVARFVTVLSSQSLFSLGELWRPRRVVIMILCDVTGFQFDLGSKSRFRAKKSRFRARNSRFCLTSADIWLRDVTEKKTPKALNLNIFVLLLAGSDRFSTTARQQKRHEVIASQAVNVWTWKAENSAT